MNVYLYIYTFHIKCFQANIRFVDPDSADFSVDNNAPTFCRKKLLKIFKFFSVFIF